MIKSDDEDRKPLTKYKNLDRRADSLPVSSPLRAELELEQRMVFHDSAGEHAGRVSGPAKVHTRAQVPPPKKKGQITLAPSTMTTTDPLCRPLTKVVRLMHGPREIARQTYAHGSAGTRRGTFDQIRVVVPVMSLPRDDQCPLTIEVTPDHASGEGMCCDNSFLHVENVSAMFFSDRPMPCDMLRVNSMGADNAGFSVGSGYHYDALDGEGDAFGRGLEFSINEDADEGDDRWEDGAGLLLFGYLSEANLGGLYAVDDDAVEEKLDEEYDEGYLACQHGHAGRGRPWRGFKRGVQCECASDDDSFIQYRS
ncbi:hypothetical protein AMAG_02475 [Allomyces macrogynus ATCC 38327]|uniref:Uncharacterized protein n=1 Tax=Allomyces macrogynus (strain ATCC 38327) TaxID=578462 RepID=A0A0L0S2B4_ALLM3|nr:hypothetical protein AMAG_02475 [Allomyces macrogynus ATCC 38327]|eukprot:KNE56693.1 hypothetical protein AMAG_02475 [Allomyces macrogynus ATCC 38327]